MENNLIEKGGTIQEKEGDNKEKEIVKINNAKYLTIGIKEIRNRLQRRINFWGENKKMKALTEYDLIQGERITELISTTRKVLINIGELVTKEALVMISEILNESELMKNKITRKHKKEGKLLWLQESRS